ncbi:cytochrome c [Flavitalea sp. BT771]|uniref:cytochrome c n=1 Tax=Flavitalea sp. BT771 TaxID=3063329 RepID=UPI0026E48638|nr:cytochrome c [Flavitalea sp. BT771]MDO6429111.1 cytochrome c [Flavitalea sp. BT771]MDV6218761.1 cytochrome c [Flavitalea sp. BT771]
MRKPYLLLSVVILFSLSHCSHPDTSTRAKVFNSGILPPFTIEIDVSKDTVLHMPEGSIIRIPAHALDGGGASHIKLVIREALRLSDMIRAGLVTTSNGRPLSSGGMIDIEAAEGQTVRIKKALSVSLPTPYLADNMELFKGALDASGNLNWTSPRPLSANPDSAGLAYGRSLFATNCASCHAIGKTILGPDLAYIGKRRERSWLYAFTKNYITLLKAGDPYANCLYNQYNKAAMNTFPNLTDTDLDYLYRSIDNESARLGLPVPDDHLKHCADSCVLYWHKRISLEGHRDSLIKNNGPLVTLERQLPRGYVSGDTGTMPGKVAIPVHQSEYYQFRIQSFGWYNIDRLLEDMPVAKMSTLTVQWDAAFRDRVNIFLLIPSARILQEGGPLEDGTNRSGFYTSDGMTPLPQGVKALVLALGEEDGQPLLGAADFITSETQTFNLQIHTLSKKELNTYLRQLDLQEIAIQLEDSKNAKQIRAADAQLKDLDKLKPASCDCACGHGDKE